MFDDDLWASSGWCSAVIARKSLMRCTGSVVAARMHDSWPCKCRRWDENLSLEANLSRLITRSHKYSLTFLLSLDGNFSSKNRKVFVSIVHACSNSPTCPFKRSLTILGPATFYFDFSLNCCSFPCCLLTSSSETFDEINDDHKSAVVDPCGPKTAHRVALLLLMHTNISLA